MKITEEQYEAQRQRIENEYIELAEELTEMLLDAMDWEHARMDAQRMVAIWLKVNGARPGKR